MNRALFFFLMFNVNSCLFPQCENSFSFYQELPNNVTILSGDNCLSDNDLSTLDSIIIKNDLDYDSPLELGTQTWLNGRLRFFVAGNYGNNSGINDTIYSLPDNIGNLDNLALLYLEWHRLSELPNSFSQMNSLISVYLNNNILSSIIDNIDNLSNLNLLDLGYNKLEYLPENICLLQNLSYLWLFNNDLEEVPDCFCNMNLSWSNDDDFGYPYFAIGANKLCDNIPDCVSESENFELSLDQFYYSFPVYSPQNCETVEISTKNELLPYQYKVSEPYPNPFNPSVNINLYIPYDRKMKIQMFNSNGILVDNISNNEVFDNGVHEISWKGSNYPSGIYFMKFSDATDHIIKKMMLIK